MDPWEVDSRYGGTGSKLSSVEVEPPQHVQNAQLLRACCSMLFMLSPQALGYNSKKVIFDEEEEDELFQWWWEATVPEIEKQVAEFEAEDQQNSLWFGKSSLEMDPQRTKHKQLIFYMIILLVCQERSQQRLSRNLRDSNLMSMVQCGFRMVWVERLNQRKGSPEAKSADANHELGRAGSFSPLRLCPKKPPN